jgi:hypothetical protein
MEVINVDVDESSYTITSSSRAVVHALHALQAKVRRIDEERKRLQRDLDESRIQQEASRWEAPTARDVLQHAEDEVRLLQLKLASQLDDVASARAQRDAARRDAEVRAAAVEAARSEDERRLRGCVAELTSTLRAREEELRVLREAYAEAEVRAAEEARLRRETGERYETRLAAAAAAAAATTEERLAGEAERCKHWEERALQAEVTLRATISAVRGEEGGAHTLLPPPAPAAPPAGPYTLQQPSMPLQELEALNISTASLATAAAHRVAEVQRQVEEEEGPTDWERPPPRPPIVPPRASRRRSSSASSGGGGQRSTLHELREAYGGAVPFLPPGRAPQPGRGANLLAHVQTSLNREKTRHAPLWAPKSIASRPGGSAAAPLQARRGKSADDAATEALRAAADAIRAALAARAGPVAAGRPSGGGSPSRRALHSLQEQAQR